MQPGLTVWTPEEEAAVTAYRMAMSEATPSSGGLGVPILVDPTVIVSAGASAAPVMQLATTTVVTTAAWRGVTAAAPSWAWKGEAVAVGDSTPTFAQPTITVYDAAGYVSASYEILADYPSFAEEMLALLGAGYTDMVANATITGSGSNQPWGVFARMVNTTTSPSHCAVATSGSLGAVDVRKAWTALPQRWRSNSTWLAPPSVETLVKQFGGTTGSSLVDYQTGLAPDGTRISALEGRPLITSDYCPAWTGTTAGSYVYPVVGDFKAGVRVISRVGLNMEVVEHPPNFSTSNLPTMSRGLYCTARVGWDVILPDSLRVISNV